MSAAIRLDAPRPLREVAATAGAAARVARWLLASPPWPGFPEPFAGQHARRAALAAIAAHFEPDAIVETGTFLGLTTGALATAGVPVYSAEIQPCWFHLARLRVRRARNVTLLCGDSVDAIAWVHERVRPQRPLAYLDAHWEERLPLRDEVAALLAGWPDTVIVIDDCRVPDDAGYGGVAIEERLIGLPPGVLVAYPAAGARAEGGARRGTLYAASGPRAQAALASAARAGLVRTPG